MESSHLPRLAVVLLATSSYVFAVVSASVDCPSQCVCTTMKCPAEYSSFCLKTFRNWQDVTCGNLSVDDIFAALPFDSNSLTFLTPVNTIALASNASHDFQNLITLTMPLNNTLQSHFSLLQKIQQVHHLNLSCGLLHVFPSFVDELKLLRTLNISSNAIEGDVDLKVDLPHLEILDLSKNSIQGLTINSELENLHTLSLQRNQMYNLPILKSLPQLGSLDISENFFVLHDTLNEHDSEDDHTRLLNCAIKLPSYVRILYLRSILLSRIPGGNCSLLADLQNLEHLYLENNVMYKIGSNEFPKVLSKSLISLVLDNNKIDWISPYAFDDFISLKLLSLSNNHLQRIPLRVIEHIGKQLDYIAPETSDSVSVLASNNVYSCDCHQDEFLEFMQNLDDSSKLLNRDDFTCSHPNWLFGSRIIDLDDTDLQCFDVRVQKAENKTCDEYADCTIGCIFDGLPYPHGHWVSPTGALISEDSLAQDSSLRKSFALSEYGHRLTIFDMRYHKTGIYKCIGDTTNNTADGIVMVAVVLAPVGSIVAIVVSAVSFLIAIVLNSVNLCHYYCQHLSDKRAMREAEAMSFRMESPIKSKEKGLHESEASLNANKYYRKYDFTCQQVFLDTVIKGAHTVKRTLYDAKNSGFSNNVWEYASHLRDRLHIELPSSVQFPRVSMPSISMPTISMPNITMPSMPNFQSINTNIEKLGTSVMHRSHNLATSVGSVFTLRWLRSGNSDNESDSDLENAGVAQVTVHVHKNNDAGSSSQELRSSEEHLPCLGQSMKSAGVRETRKTRFLSKTARFRNGDNSDGDHPPRRTKSVRFSESSRPSLEQNLRRSASYSALTKFFEQQPERSLLLEDERVTVNAVSAYVRESYQFETTV